MKYYFGLAPQGDIHAIIAEDQVHSFIPVMVQSIDAAQRIRIWCRQAPLDTTDVLLQLWESKLWIVSGEDMQLKLKLSPEPVVLARGDHVKLFQSLMDSNLWNACFQKP